MKNLSMMMKKAQEMQEKMAEMQSDLEKTEVEGSAGAGMITVTLNGKGHMKSLSIDPSLFKAEDKEVVEDLIVAAHNAAKTKAEEKMQAGMSDLTGGLPLPEGFKMPF